VAEGLFWRRKKFLLRGTYLALRALASSFNPIPALDNIGLEADRARTTVQLEKKAAGIAEDGAEFIPAP
jgi:hypothetical protein